MVIVRVDHSRNTEHDGITQLSARYSAKNWLSNAHVTTRRIDVSIPNDKFLRYRLIIVVYPALGYHDIIIIFYV